MTEVTKHTPAPWEIDLSGISKIGIFRRGFRIAVIKKLAHAWEEQLANARLIAAAPELLEVLKALRNECSGSPRPHVLISLMEKADAVISKAEGRP